MTWRGPSLRTAVVAVALSVLTARIAWAADGPAPVIKPWYISITSAVPVAVGGLAGLEFQWRYTDRTFVRLGGGTSLLLSGAYISYGHLLGTNEFIVVGLDANYVVPLFDQPLVMPGVHAGGGWEWFGRWTRTALSFEVGYPWLIGARFSVGL